MPIASDLLGRQLTLSIRRFASPGAFLALDGQRPSPDEDSILLPNAEVPDDAVVGQKLEVFMYLDSEDRPVLTTRSPKLHLGEVAFLEVTDVTRIGAFVDWGLPKELLVPFSEQTRDMRVGERHAIGLYLDKSERLTGTMRIAEMLRPA